MISAICRLSFFAIPSVSRRTASRALLLPATLAVIALLSVSQAWATAAPTTTTLTVTSSGSAVTSVAAGTVVTLTATVVSGSTPVNPGQIRFCDASAKYCEDSALLATAQLTSSGIATYKFRPGIGSHSYQAVFVGTKTYATGTSTMAALTVAGKYPTTTTITSSGSPSNRTLTATVAGADKTAAPTGDVSFLDTTNGNSLLGTEALGAATLSENFVPILGYSVGFLPYQIVVGDFNGDGIPDLASSNITGTVNGTLTVALGNGDGTFTVKSSPPAGPVPFGVAAGDFNGDGILDLAVSGYWNGVGSVTVLLGNGDGTFTTKSATNVGETLLGIAAADFNGDGILDLAAVDSDSNTVVVLLGNGDGTFTTGSTTSVGTFPYSLAVGDFNGDGIPDLAVVNPGGGGVTVLLGNGDGTFTTKSTINAAVSAAANSIAVGDFNGDGIPDLVIGGVSALTILLGNGDGTFIAKSTLTVNNGQSVAVADFNGDGIPDVVTGGGLNNDSGDGSNTFTVLLGNGDGTFAIQSSSDAGLLAGVAVGDFNGDGAPDVAALAGTVTIFLNEFSQSTATLNNVSLLGTGTHQVEASYPGDANYNSSTSTTLPLLAAEVATTLNLSSSANPSIVGSQITLTATLSPYSSGPFTTNGETITFYNGGTNIGTGTLSSGVVTLNIASLPLGTDTLTATYPGDGNFTAATSNAVAQLVETPTATPAFSPTPGLYYTTQTVKITDTTPGAVIYYTTNGTPATTSSTMYMTGPITVSSSETLEAIAVAPNYGPSAVATAAYVIAADTPVLTPPGGTYTSAQMVSITSATPGATIYYTTDGSVPSRSSPVFNPMNPIPVNATETIKAYAVAPGYGLSPEGWAQYTIIPPYAPTPTFSLAAGFYDSSVQVTIMDSLAGAKIYYTTNHTTPTTASPLYNGIPITISSTEQLQAIAVATNYSPSAVAIGDYYVAAAKPFFSKPSGTYTGPQMVSITDTTPGALIYYTTDGTTPGRSSPTLSPGGSITVSSSETIKALAVATGYTTSPEGVATYVIAP